MADAILDWLREEPVLGPTALHGKLFEKYKIEIPYMRIFNAREKALDRINGQWNDIFSCFTLSKLKWRWQVQGVL